MRIFLVISGHFDIYPGQARSWGTLWLGQTNKGATPGVLQCSSDELESCQNRDNYGERGNFSPVIITMTSDLVNEAQISLQSVHCQLENEISLWSHLYMRTYFFLWSIVDVWHRQWGRGTFRGLLDWVGSETFLTSSPNEEEEVWGVVGMGTMW